MILRVHKEQVDRLDLEKVGENYVSGREGYTERDWLIFVSNLRIL